MEDFLESAASLTTLFVTRIENHSRHGDNDLHGKTIYGFMLIRTNPDISQSANECSYRAFALPPIAKGPFLPHNTIPEQSLGGVSRKRI